ncbi:VanZ family protein [Ammoniphilus sp. 3BR4]|uniref:VanZ family protein n=1 Tax=Ammoniphilus sp. 3BR4 TaxID=3158265 RepID=UPI0034662BF9
MAILDVEVTFYAMIGIDKIYHVLFYGMLALVLGSIACRLSPRTRALPRLLWIALGLLLISVLEEYRQFFDLNRDTEYLDAVANLAGIALGLIFPVAAHVSQIRQGRIRIQRRLVFSFVLLVPLFYGLTFFTSKGPPTPFFAQGTVQTDGISVQAGSLVAPQGYHRLQAKYLPQLLYIENEYIRELSELIVYTQEHGNLAHHLWLMVQLGNAVDTQFDQIERSMKRSAQEAGLPLSITKQVKKEFMQRKKAHRARLIKHAIIEKKLPPVTRKL